MEKRIKRFIIYFVIGMIFLAFISKTITNATIPVITYSTTQSGAVTPEVSCYGQVITEDYEEVTFEVPVKIKDILYNESKRLPKEQPMITLDMDFTNEQIKRLEMELYKLNVDLAINKKLIRQLSDHTEMERQIYLLQTDIDSLNEDILNTRALYENGAASEEDLDKLMDDLSMKKTELQWVKEDLQKQNNDDEEQKDIYEAEQLSMEAQIELLTIELDKYISLNEEITMPYTCFIKDIKVKEGDLVQAYTPIVMVLNRDANMTFEALFPIDKEGEIWRGKKVDVFFDGSVAKGHIEYIYNNEDGKNLILGIELEEGSDVYVGQKGKVKIKFPTQNYAAWVPLEAIREDGNGPYVFTIYERQSILGEKFVVEKRSVEVGERSDVIIGITKGLFSGEKIVNSSNKPLVDGSDVYVQE